MASVLLRDTYSKDGQDVSASVPRVLVGEQAMKEWYINLTNCLHHAIAPAHTHGISDVWTHARPNLLLAHTPELGWLLLHIF